MTNDTAKPASEGPPARTVRSDAQRNEDAVLEAAKTVFATKGVDAPVREIAAQAGVGIGTLYRRFPNRADLIAAVFRREVDACTAEAAALSRDYAPGEALLRWLDRYVAFIGTKRGLASALQSGEPAFETLPAYFRASFEPTLTALLAAAAAKGEARGDVDAFDLLRAIGNLCTAKGPDGPDHSRRMVRLLLDGLLCMR